ILYFGDTARVPYGGKSRPVIERYSIEISGYLLAEGAKAIVVACNTASALALDRLRSLFRAPVLGVVEPGAAAAAQLTRNKQIGVWATRATILSNAYERAIRNNLPDASIVSVPCPLLVPLIEEGLLDDPITHLALQRYLQPVLHCKADTLVLGCTHYPLLRHSIQQLAPHLQLIDSAENCALALSQLLDKNRLRNPLKSRNGRIRAIFTDIPGEFLQKASQLLDLHIPTPEIRSLPA
ncbi:MAG: glutamate racemase, partial [Chthoniobacterales bacterium]|nr:glutamate racemase [Chthoniobacterales bacterium]